MTLSNVFDKTIVRPNSKVSYFANLLIHEFPNSLFYTLSEDHSLPFPKTDVLFFGPGDLLVVFWSKSLIRSSDTLGIIDAVSI